MLRQNLKILTRIFFSTTHSAPQCQKEKTRQGKEPQLFHIFSISHMSALPLLKKVFIYVV